MLRILLYILGILIVSISISFIIIYLNLLNMGYSFLDYVNFIIRRIEVVIIIVGVLLLFISLRKEK